MQRKEHLLDVIRVLYKWKVFILIVCLITLVGSVILSLMMDNYYQSSTLFYATNNDLAKPNPIGNQDNIRYYYGAGEDMDRIMTLAESERLANFLIDSFDLYNHYGIDQNDEKRHFRVMEVFSSQYKVLKTKYDAIEILVEDVDPRLAMNMANVARNKVNQFAQEMIRNSQWQQIKMMKSNLTERNKKMNQLEDTLLVIRKKYGILNPATQSRDLPELLLIKSAKLNEEKGRLAELKKYSSIPQDTIIYSTARIRGLESEVASLRTQVGKFTEGFAGSEKLYRFHQINKDEIGNEQQRLAQLEAVYNNEFTAINLVQAAGYPRDKSRPKRSIIVIVSVLMAFILTCIGVLLTDSYKSINWQEVLHG